MNFGQRPIPGYWYSNSAGQLLQCRAFLYHEGQPARIWIEDITGARQSISPAGWKEMDLILHSPVEVVNR